MYTDFIQKPVWKKMMDIAVDVFYLSDNLPKREDYALTSQIRRSAESISANIAEGFGRSGNKDKTMFYKFARGSAFEQESFDLRDPGKVFSRRSISILDF